MKKRISPKTIKTEITRGYAGLGAAFLMWLMKQEEDPNGVLIDANEVANDMWDIIDAHFIPYVNEYVKDHMGPVDPGDLDKDPVEPPEPEPTPEPEPEPEPQPDDSGMPGFNSKERVHWSGEYMHHRDENDASKPHTKQRLFRFSKCGREYGGPIKIVWSDGRSMTTNGNQWSYPGGNDWNDKTKYQPGCGDGTVPHCECYAKVGTTPDYVDLYYNK